MADNQTMNTAEVEKQLEQQKKFYLSPKEMASYILSGVGDKNWETFNGNNEFFYTTTFQSYRHLYFIQQGRVILFTSPVETKRDIKRQVLILYETI